MQRLLSKVSLMCFVFTFMPSMQSVRSISSPLVSIVMDWRTLCMIIGQKTFSSKLLLWQALSMTLSFPMTCIAIISVASGIDGFIFPGIIDEPACTGGSVISIRPAFGPLLMLLRSEQILRRLMLRERNVAEKFRKAFMLLAISVRFLAEVSLMPTSLLSSLVTV